MFLNGSIVYLAINMILLFFFGPKLERKIGSSKFIIIYFGSGILSAFSRIFINPMLLVGSSGAIIGVLACFAIITINIWRAFFAIILVIFIQILFFGMEGTIVRLINFPFNIFGLLFGLISGIIIRLQNQRNN